MPELRKSSMSVVPDSRPRSSATQTETASSARRSQFFRKVSRAVQTVAPGGTSRANVLMSAWLITTEPVDAPYRERTAATSCVLGTGLLALITGLMIDVGSVEL